jgi:hypothetical protein
MMVADSGPLYSYNSHLQHEQCLHCVSDHFDVILMDFFSLKNNDISK